MELWGYVLNTVQYNKRIKKPPSKVAQKNSNPLLFLTASTAQMAQTEEFMFQNLAYRPTVYRTGGSSTSSRSVIDTPAQQRTPLFIHLAFSLEMIRRVKPDFFRIFLFWYFDVLCEDQLVPKKFLSFQIHIAYLNLTFQDFLCWYFDVLRKDQLIPNNIFSFQIHIAYFLIWWKLPNNPGSSIIKNQIKS